MDIKNSRLPTETKKNVLVILGDDIVCTFIRSLLEYIDGVKVICINALKWKDEAQIVDMISINQVKSVFVIGIPNIQTLNQFSKTLKNKGINLLTHSLNLYIGDDIENEKHHDLFPLRWICNHIKKEITLTKCEDMYLNFHMENKNVECRLMGRRMKETQNFFLGLTDFERKQDMKNCENGVLSFLSCKTPLYEIIEAGKKIASVHWSIIQGICRNSKLLKLENNMNAVIANASSYELIELIHIGLCAGGNNTNITIVSFRDFTNEGHLFYARATGYEIGKTLTFMSSYEGIGDPTGSQGKIYNEIPGKVNL